MASKKVKRIKTPQERNLQGFGLFGISVLDDFYSCLCCPECFETGSLYEEDEDRRKGLSSFLNIFCGFGYKKVVHLQDC